MLRERDNHDAVLCQSLLASYINICNRAITHNHNRFPYHQIWQAARQKDMPLLVHAQVGECDPVIDMYLEVAWWPAPYITILPGKPPGDDAPVREWAVPLAHLLHVAAHDMHYIACPAELDWDWMMPE